MELKKKILKLLPQAVVFKYLTFSPRGDTRPDINAQRFRTHKTKGFSGLIPAEARQKPNNFETQEPSSPKVSCTGRVKLKSKISEKNHASSTKGFKSGYLKIERAWPNATKKKNLGIKKIFCGGRKIDKSDDGAEPARESGPALSQMRRFANSRNCEALLNFDWTTEEDSAEEGQRRY